MAQTKMNLQDWMSGVQDQFRGLNPKEPGTWPLTPRIAVWLLVTLAVVGLAWFLVLSDAATELDAVREQEPKLKEQYRDKLAQAINLDALKKQKEDVQIYVSQLEKQLPGKAEMDALLSDINQAGIGRGLQFDLFKPGQVVIKDYYAELPIAVGVSGRYNDIGAFAGDIANLSRIVTLHDLAIEPMQGRDGNGTLVLTATARTYRYLDPAEVAAMKQAAKKNDKTQGANT